MRFVSCVGIVHCMVAISAGECVDMTRTFELDNLPAFDSIIKTPRDTRIRTKVTSDGLIQSRRPEREEQLTMSRTMLNLRHAQLGVLSRQRQEELNLVPERFVQNAYRIGTGGRPIASVRDELFLDEGVCILRSAYSRRIRYELGIATFTHAKHRNIVFSFHDSKLALRHASSSPRADPIRFCFPHGDPRRRR